MIKILCTLFTFLIFAPTAMAGLYDDILNENPYSKCSTPECATMLYHQRMMILDNLERQNQQIDIQNMLQSPVEEDIRIKYGYNSMGEYVPTAIGNQKIHYGYNSQGEYVPVRIGK